MGGACERGGRVRKAIRGPTGPCTLPKYSVLVVSIHTVGRVCIRAPRATHGDGIDSIGRSRIMPIVVARIIWRHLELI